MAPLLLVEAIAMLAPLLLGEAIAMLEPLLLLEAIARGALTSWLSFEFSKCNNE
uniref:Uncharacterized protein n=1 Tax=Rhodnius prolixus TaxID=13249 RepID=T1HDR9_RHOPR